MEGAVTKDKANQSPHPPPQMKQQGAGNDEASHQLTSHRIYGPQDWKIT